MQKLGLKACVHMRTSVHGLSHAEQRPELETRERQWQSRREDHPAWGRGHGKGRRGANKRKLWRHIYLKIPWQNPPLCMLTSNTNLKAYVGISTKVTEPNYRGEKKKKEDYLYAVSIPTFTFFIYQFCLLLRGRHLFHFFWCCNLEGRIMKQLLASSITNITPSSPTFS